MKSGLQVFSEVEIAIYFVATSVVTLDLGGASTQVGFIFWSLRQQKSSIKKYININKVTKKLALQISFVPMLGSTLQVLTYTLHMYCTYTFISCDVRYNAIQFPTPSLCF
jgi:hypothetical protein